MVHGNFRMLKQLGAAWLIVATTLLVATWSQSVAQPAADVAPDDRLYLEISYRCHDCEIIRREYPGISPWGRLNGEAFVFQEFSGVRFWELLLRASTNEEKSAIYELMREDWTKESHLDSVLRLARQMTNGRTPLSAAAPRKSSAQSPSLASRPWHRVGEYRGERFFATGPAYQGETRNLQPKN